MPVPSGRMRFSYDDADGEKAFHRRRDELGEAFAQWLNTQDVAGDPNDAGLLMDWKFNYGDGALDTWTVPDVSEFLLDWCPRKLSAAPADCVEIPKSVAAFVEFLAHHGLLGRGSQAPAQIRKYCEQTTARFVKEMGNPANFGMAKSVFGGVGGLEPGAVDSPESLAALLGQFSDDANPYDDYDDADADADADEQLTIGPLRLPDPDEQLTAIRDAPDMHRLRNLAQWCPAPGRPLTAKGNLRLADARHLVELLDTGDDPELGGRRQLSSATDLAHLNDLIETAIQAGVARRQKGRLLAVARFAELDEITAYEKVVRAAVAERPEDQVQGPLARLVASLAPLMTLPDSYVGHLSAALLAVGDEGIPTDELLELTLGGGTNVANAGAALFRSLVLPRAARLLDRLVELGVVAVTDAEQPCRDCDEEHAVATLTAAGMPIAVGLAREAGFEVVLRPDPATATPADLVELLGYVEPAEWERDAAQWFAAQPDPTAAAAALVCAITAADQELIAAAAGLVGVDAVLGEYAVEAVRAQLGGPHDGVVVQWLIARSALDPASIDPLRIVSGLVDVLGSTLDHASPAEVVAYFGVGSRDEQLAMLSEIWRLDHPRLDEVLEAIGGHHPVKAIAKAARRALMKHRSRRASS